MNTRRAAPLVRRRRKLTPGEVVDVLRKNESDCRQEALSAITEARRALLRGADRDIVVRHILEALLYVGEGRGHGNGAADVLEIDRRVVG